LFDATFNDMQSKVAGIFSQMLSRPPTAADEAAQLQQLQSLADQGYAFVLIAHSQGNLFVNAAYDGLRSSRPNTGAEVVHIAPASPTPCAGTMCAVADIDLVINALRIQGNDTVPAANLNLPASTADLTGHTLVGTYLDPARAARAKVGGMVQAVLGAL
jgi:hypothetical protein